MNKSRFKVGDLAYWAPLETNGQCDVGLVVKVWKIDWVRADHMLKILWFVQDDGFLNMADDVVYTQQEWEQLEK